MTNGGMKKEGRLRKRTGEDRCKIKGSGRGQEGSQDKSK